MCKWKTSQNDALGIWELIQDENIEVKNKLLIYLHSHNVAPDAMVSNFFLEKGVDIFLWLDVCTVQYIYRWDSKSFGTL